MNKALWLIGGLGLGTGLMYMLDPERGEHRRMLARGQVETYRRQADTLLDQTRQALSEQTRTLGQQARGLMAQARLPLRGGDKRDAVWREGAQQMGTTGLLLFGCVGLGIGLMYMLDPNVGTRRRALLRDKTRSYWYRTGALIEKTVRDARNRTRGLLGEARTQLQGAVEMPDDAALEARVRAQLGHAISHGGAIRVTAHQGRVTLSGPISPSAADKLLATVASVAGVTEVVNDLDVRAEPISGWHVSNPVR